MESDPVPPSSPPHATAAELSESPFFEPHYKAFNSKSSSPPPLFSSDDSRESADISNYESPRIFKNKRKGGWWDTGDSAQSTLEFKKAKMTRNYDSGVYMMSDGTESFESLPVQHKSPFGPDGLDKLPSQNVGVASTSVSRAPTSKEEDEFCAVLDVLLEENSEVYEFFRRNLQDQDIGRIGELTSVIKNVPDPGGELPAEGQYRSMVPRLYVNFKGNKLRHLTPSLFDVENLNSLILTDNNIDELPAEIRHLSNLRVLNISNNNLRWLPFDLLELYGANGQMEILADSGIPWLEPKVRQRFDQSGIRNHVPGTEAALQVPDAKLQIASKVQNIQQIIDSHPGREELLWWLRNIELIASSVEIPRAGFFPHHPSIETTSAPMYLARTLVSYFDETNNLVKGSPAPPSSNDDDFVIITETERGAHGVPASIFSPAQDAKHTNSLATMAVHSALEHMYHEDLSYQDLRERIGEPLPRVAAALLEQAERNNCAGFGEFRECHVCEREYIIARAEWVEWWIVKSCKVLPFKVRVCSWACVPDEMRIKPARELGW